MAQPTPSRRAVLAAAVGAVAAPALVRADDEILHPTTAPAGQAKIWHDLKVGIASYSFRKLSLEVTIDAVKRLNLHYISIKDAHLPMNSTTEQRKAVVSKCKDAGITPISCGVVSLKNDEKNIRQAFEYARDLGVPVMVCQPDPPALPKLDAFVKEFDIKLAIHNHGPEAPYFHSPYDTWKAIQNNDPRVGLCVDVGHTARAGAVPQQAIRDCAARVYDVHMKDVSDIHGKDGSVEITVGRGVLDIKAILAALIDIKFAGHVGLEHEQNPENPLPGCAESIGYIRGVLAYM